VILFAFLSIFFAISDHVIFGNNSVFYQPNDQEVQTDAWKLNKFRLTADGECEDANTIGCIYQKATFSETGDGGVGESFKFVSLNILESNGGTYVLELIKLSFIFFIVYSVLGLIEQISAAMVDAAGGGAAALSAIPQANPIGIAQGIFSGAKMAALSPYYAAKGVYKAGRAVYKNPRAAAAVLMAATAPVSVPIALVAGGIKMRSDSRSHKAAVRRAAEKKVQQGGSAAAATQAASKGDKGSSDGASAASTTTGPRSRTRAGGGEGSGGTTGPRSRTRAGGGEGGMAAGARSRLDASLGKGNPLAARRGSSGGSAGDASKPDSGRGSSGKKGIKAGDSSSSGSTGEDKK
jgi:hypothetical protein